MTRLAADEDFNNAILRGLLRERPSLDIVRIQDSPMYGAKDPPVLEWLAQEGRVLLTHDVNTMTKHGGERLRKGLPMPGIIVVRQDCPIGRAIRDILIVLEASLEGELEGQIFYLPFGTVT